MVKKRNQNRQETKNDPITKRLDALLRLIIETGKPRGKDRLSHAAAARLLQSVGLTPTEIARIFGKSSASGVSKYLYSKKEEVGSHAARKKR